MRTDLCSRKPFSWQTSNSSLHNHIVAGHLDKYLELVKKHNWSVQIEAVCSAFSVGYMFRTLCEAINEGHKLSSLPPPPSPKVGDAHPHDCPCKLTQEPKKNGITIPVFSISMLHKALVKFIVADDQVSTFTTVWCWNASNSITVYQCY